MIPKCRRHQVTALDHCCGSHRKSTLELSAHVVDWLLCGTNNMNNVRHVGSVECTIVRRSCVMLLLFVVVGGCQIGVLVHSLNEYRTHGISATFTRIVIERSHFSVKKGASGVFVVDTIKSSEMMMVIKLGAKSLDQQEVTNHVRLQTYLIHLAGLYI